MRIPLKNGYVLLSDPLNFWIAKERTIDKGKNKGKQYDQVVSGYYSNINDLLVAFVDRRVGALECETLEDMGKQITKLKREIKSWKKMLTLDQLNKLEQSIRAEFKP